MTEQARIRIQEAKSHLVQAASYLAEDPANDELWRDVCSARATLKAYAKCAA